MARFRNYPELKQKPPQHTRNMCYRIHICTQDFDIWYLDQIYQKVNFRELAQCLTADIDPYYRTIAQPKITIIVCQYLFDVVLLWKIYRERFLNSIYYDIQIPSLKDEL